MRIGVRHAIGDLNRIPEPADAVALAVKITLRELAKAGPAWDTLSITVRLDDTFVDQHFVAAEALEA